MTDIHRFAVRYAGGTYEISREGEGDSPKLFYGTTPGGADRAFLCVMKEARLSMPSPLEGHRLYFFLELEDGTVLTAASRGVEISGVENFRDMGGYPAVDGKTVKWGRFFRGGPLCGLGDGEKDALAGLGLKRVIDYRTRQEAERLPDECPPGAEYFWMSAAPKEKRFQEFTQRDTLTHMKLVRTKEDARQVFQLFTDLYAAMPFESDAFLQMLQFLDSEETVPIYQHCSAGKDRTGVGSAVLLLALGVKEEVVVEDYLLSRVFREEINRRHVERMVAAGITGVAEELVKRMMTGIEGLIQAALLAIHEKYPSTEAFFEGEYGITGERLARWREMHTC